MSTRAAQILGRFPAHLDATRPDKQLGFVTAEMAAHLDLLATDLAGVRRAHRLAHADTLRDLDFIAGLHGIGAVDFDVLARKRQRLPELATALEQAIAVGPTRRDAAAATLLALFGVDPASPGLALLTSPSSPLSPPSPPASPPSSLDAAARALAALARQEVGFAEMLAATRARIAEICSIHAQGNGTVRALIEGAANALDFDLDLDRNRAVRAALLQEPTVAASLHPTVDDGLIHSRDLFVHSTFVRPRMTLPPLPDGSPVPLADDIIGIEENPLRREYWPVDDANPPMPTTQTLPLQDSGGDTVGGRWRFSVQRRGFGRELLQINVTGVGDRTVGPMLVNRDEGLGIGWSGTVPDGKTLQFTEEGRALLDGADVTSSAFSWQGACFAMPTADGETSDDQLTPKRDFVFYGPGLDAGQETRVATFAVASPAGALDREAVFPHAGDAVDPPGIGTGKTRLALFLQEAHLSGDRLVTPRTATGFAGDPSQPSVPASVFAPSPSDTAAPAPEALLSLSWMEHEAYAARVWIPKQLAQLDGEGLPISERVRLALERFRPAGVNVTVQYIDDTWVLGNGYLVEGDTPDPNLELTGGTVLAGSPLASPPSPPAH